MKKFQPLVTCIIPVYNAEKYLAQAVDSLLCQTYSHLEIILVDDKSTDLSWEICQEYSRKHPDVIRVYQNKHNSGSPLRGREKGIREASGEWITFMDCDDYVEPLYVENLVRTTENGRYDIAVTGHTKVYANGKKEDFLWQNYNQTTQQRLFSFYKNFLKGDFWTDPADTVGQNLIRASICKQTDLSEYSNLIYAEDTLMALAFLSNSKNGVNFNDEHDFMWRQVDGSGSHGGFSERTDKQEFHTACLNLFYRPDVYKIIAREGPKISVIVPVYNVEAYLTECLESILNQTYCNLEVIIVNDGSEDGSENIIDHFSKKDNRVITIKQINLGLNAARATGVGSATGSYICFVDGDDKIHPDYIKSLYESILKYDVDISVCGFREFDTANDTASFTLNKSDINLKIVSKKDRIAFFLGIAFGAENIYPVTAWGKLYDVSILKATDWEFSNYRRHEDNFESLQWYTAAQQGVAITNIELYFYRKNPQSITQTNKPNINPDGQPINYFQYTKELYDKTKAYLNDNAFDDMILENFTKINLLQFERYYQKGQLDYESFTDGLNNIRYSIRTYSTQNEQLKRSLKIHESELNSILSSLSWKLTQAARRSKGLIKKIHNRLTGVK